MWQGYLTDPPSSMTYDSVIGSETVTIAFLVAALNDLKVLAGDMQNAYLNAFTKEKINLRWVRNGRWIKERS